MKDLDKYNTIVSLYNNKRYAELEGYLSDNLYNHDTLRLAQFMLDLDYNLADYLDLMAYCHDLDIK